MKIVSQFTFEIEDKIALIPVHLMEVSKSDFLFCAQFWEHTNLVVEKQVWQYNFHAHHQLEKRLFKEDQTAILSAPSEEQRTGSDFI